MSNFSFTRTATVKSVFEKFTSELTKVKEQQNQIVDKAAKEQKDLQEKIEAAADRQLNAEKEVDQANLAIKNIGEMLGVQTGEPEGTDTEEHF